MLDSPRRVKDPSPRMVTGVSHRTVPAQFSYQMSKALREEDQTPTPAPDTSQHNPARRDLEPTSSTFLSQLHPKICLPGAVTVLEGEATCQNSPAWGNPSSCSPGRPFLSSEGSSVWFPHRSTAVIPQSVADPQLVFSLIYVRAYLCPLLKTIQFVSAVNGTVYHPAAVCLLPEMSFTPVLIMEKSF